MDLELSRLVQKILPFPLFLAFYILQVGHLNKKVPQQQKNGACKRIWSYLVQFRRYRRFRSFWHFTFYRLVTKTKKLCDTKILGHAKGFGVISFGLKDIAVSALFCILHFTSWSPKRKSCMTPKYWAMQKDLELSRLV